MLGAELMPRKFNFRFADGFTLMELMIAVAVLGILAVAAVPSVQSILYSNQVSGQTNEIVAMLNFARNTAIRTSGDVDAVFTAEASGWSGFVEDPDGGRPDDCTAANALRCADSQRVLLESAKDFTFDKRGYLKDATFLTDGNVTIETMWLQHESCSNAQHRSRIEVRPTGQVTSCNVACGNTETTC